MAEKKDLINIRKVIADKNPKLLKQLPEFAIRYLERISHQDEINGLLKNNSEKTGFEFCQAAIEHFRMEVEAHGIENIPKTGGAVLASNHPLGGMDAMALGAVLEPHDWELKFVANDILMNIPNLKNMFIGINKHGANAKESLKDFNEQFAKDQLICIFPAGLVSRRTKGKVRDLDWKKTFITRSKKHKKLIIPTYVDGTLSNFFYSLANIRKFTGLKANIEMLYLADEMMKLKGKKVNISFGKPIDPATFDRSKNDKAWAAFVREKVYELAK